ncbi:MAG: pseudouridine synthase [Candidatus Absconditabacterales bacterium]|nr:pseudouridine synthase [Candidatus Absconditabacterales bacterium]
MRLDQYMGRMGWVSRTQATKILKKHPMTINTDSTTDPSLLVSHNDIIDRPYMGITQHIVRLSVTILLHKPSGYVCSDRHEGQRRSWRDLIEDCPLHKDLRCAGRLDVDTTGLLIASTDGQFIHRIISPKFLCPKTYTVTLKKTITDEDCRQLEAGVMLDDGLTKPAQVQRLSDSSINLTLTEGKYHQVKRMCLAIHNECIGLHRWRVGKRNLGDIPPGQRRLVP